jgi:hypothetical protein
MDTRIAGKGRSFWVASLVATLLLLLGSHRVVAQSSQQTPKKSPSAQTATLTPQEKEAQKHYRIALEAIKNNDFTTASDELKAAADLAPKNALIWYNLAVVESKKGDSTPALEHLQKAENLGLPKGVQNDADQLEAKLAYDAKKKAQKDAFAGKFAEFYNYGRGSFAGGCGNGHDPFGVNGPKGDWLAHNYNYNQARVTGFQNDWRMVGLVIHEDYYNSRLGGFTQNEHRSGTAIFDPVDLSPDYAIRQQPTFCNNGTFVYLLSFRSQRQGAIHFHGETKVESGMPPNVATTTTQWTDGDEVVLMFPNRDSAQKLANILSELIRMSTDLQ